MSDYYSADWFSLKESDMEESKFWEGQLQKRIPRSTQWKGEYADVRHICKHLKFEYPGLLCKN